MPAAPERTPAYRIPREKSDTRPEDALTGEAICPRCNGTGMLDEQPCPDCRASGHISIIDGKR